MPRSSPFPSVAPFLCPHVSEPKRHVPSNWLAGRMLSPLVVFFPKRRHGRRPFSPCGRSPLLALIRFATASLFSRAVEGFLKLYFFCEAASDLDCSCGDLFFSFLGFRPPPMVRLVACSPPFLYSSFSFFFPLRLCTDKSHLLFFFCLHEWFSSLINLFAPSASLLSSTRNDPLGGVFPFFRSVLQPLSSPFP